MAAATRGQAKKSLAEQFKKSLDLLVHKPKNRGEEFRRRALVHRLCRRGIQLVCFLAFPSVFSASFNGVKYVFTQMGAHEPIELTAFVSLLLCVLAFTCLFGRFFCGYCCSFGTLGDVVYALAAPLRRALGLEHKRMPERARGVLWLVKYLVLAAVCVACLLGTWPEVSGLSPWVAFAGIDALNVDGIAAGSFVLLALVVVGMALEERFFCQFLCPMGAVFSLLPVLPASVLTRDRALCAKGCNRCQDACPVGIHPQRHDLPSGECIACGRCADGCPVQNVALVGHGKQARLRGTEVALTLAKAVVFLAMCSLVM
ncbi:4Fe-4S binding protein [Paratractidigestivibacter faecalis]|uniref:4Fe-4S binding protein n=1 Tax=Paratractidigestivibacter faecalis TaxID=2292441 RepID=A0ABV1IFJ3_9ACTN